MARLTGLGSFLLVTVAVLALLRGVHVAVPLVLPDTRPGPFTLASLDEVEGRAGFAPLVPAYHPVALGAGAPSLTVARAPHPTFVVVWRGERYLSITQRRGGAMPAHPPVSVPLDDIPDSLWWSEGAVQHVVLRRGDLWISLETDLPRRDVRRIADTLRPYLERRGQPSSTGMIALRIA